MLAGRRTFLVQSAADSQWLVPLLDSGGGGPYSFVDLGLPLLETQKLSARCGSNMISFPSGSQPQVVGPIRNR